MKVFVFIIGVAYIRKRVGSFSHRFFFKLSFEKPTIMFFNVPHKRERNKK
jgi:hypothetical protein